MSWMVHGLNPGGGEIFCTCPDRPWGPTQAPVQQIPDLFPGGKAAGYGINHPPPSSTKVKESVELYINPPPGPSWPVLGWTLRFYLLCIYCKVKVKQSHYRPLGLQKVEAPRFLDNRHMKVVRLSALRTGRIYSPPGKVPGTHFC
jgi:hypothetical protein